MFLFWFQNPFRDANVYVKRTATLFMMIEGLGFRLLYDANGRIYITLQPFYMKQVSNFYAMALFNDIVTVDRSKHIVLMKCNNIGDLSSKMCNKGVILHFY